MKKYYAPDVDIVSFSTNDIMTGSRIIGEADATATGFEDCGDMKSVFGL
jgi:hypothetical protein